MSPGHSAATATVLLLLAIAAILVVWMRLSSRPPERFSGDGGPAAQPPIYVTMSTSPTRIALIQPVIDRLMQQTRVPTMIIVNLPHVFKRNNQTFGDVPRFLSDNPIVYINRCEDIGPATKVLPVLDLDFIGPDDMVLSVDDDIEVPLDFVETFARYGAMYPHATITGCSGYQIDDEHADPRVRRVELLEGFSGVLYRKRFLRGFDTSDIFATSPACYNGDDLILSNHLAKTRVPVLMMEPPFCVGRVNSYYYGNQHDALHIMSASVPSNFYGHDYLGCRDSLREQNRLHLTHTHHLQR